MASKAQNKNPFLMTELDTCDTSQDVASFNPFLVGEESSLTSNPFLQAIDNEAASQGASNATNPFAAFFSTPPTEGSAYSAEIIVNPSYVKQSPENSSIANKDIKSSNVNLLDDIFGSAGDISNENNSTVLSSATPILSNRESVEMRIRKGSVESQQRLSSEMQWSNTNLSQRSSMDIRRQSDVQWQSTMPRVNVDTRRQSDAQWRTNDSRRTSVDNGERPAPPRRPPPPRPGAPSKETKDLILTVTGALEATSSDLLDRLAATRTPSPTPFAELHSPSPTPDLINDLLGDEDIPTNTLPHYVGGRTQDINEDEFNVFDAIANLPKGDDIKPLEEMKPKKLPPPLPTRPPLPPSIKQETGNYVFEIPAAETIHNVTPFDTVNTFPGTAGSVFDHMGEKEIIEAASRKSSVISESMSRRGSSDVTNVSQSMKLRSASPDYPPIYDVSVIKGSNPPSQTSSTENISSLATSKPFDQLQFPEKYTHVRKASHDVSWENVQVIPTHKKYSLDYSSSAFLDKMSKGEEADSNKILEVPKFPVFSTTPILSCENIANQDSDFDASNENVSYTDPFKEGSKVPEVAEIRSSDEFDAFSAKFESFNDRNIQGKSSDPFDPFSSAAGSAVNQEEGDFGSVGFGSENTFDEFLALNKPPAGIEANEPFTAESWSDDKENSFVASAGNGYLQDAASSFNPYSSSTAKKFSLTLDGAEPKITRGESDETPQTPLFDEDVSQPLEPFPRVDYDGPGWEMQIRYPLRKKITGQRFWKKVFVRLVYQGEIPHLELVNRDDGKETLLHEWPIQPCYAISDIGAQQYDQYGKIFTVKIQFVVYKERPGVRPGQVTKAERLTNKLSQFAAYAIQGDYQGVKEFGSDLKKLGLPVEHSPQISLICKLGSHNYEDMKQFSVCVEEAMWRLSAHRDNIHITYKMEEVQITAVDELYVEQSSNGAVNKQIARVRLFFLGFLTGMPDIELGVNDLWRQGKEVVGRHDIIPVVTEEWIRLENVEFHNCVQQDVYQETRTIRFKPPDACYLELMRFRVRPPKNRELPLQVKTIFRVTGNKVDILSDILVPGFTSRKLGQIPCEDVSVRIPIPECWIYLFRVEKHFRYGSVKSAHRRTGKVKGFERFLGAVENLEPHLIEVTSGHAKYEHHHRAIVWRMSRLPKEGQGAYTTHNLICHLALTSFDQIPEELAKYCYVEFTMPITQVSHTTVRSVSISNSDSDTPPEKYVRHLARHEYKVEIEHTHAEIEADYISVTRVKPAPKIEDVQARTPVIPEKSPESDSDFSD